MGMSGPRSSRQYDVVADARRRWSAEQVVGMRILAQRLPAPAAPERRSM